MRVHIFDPQLGRGPGHPPICDQLVADELRRRGIDVTLYGAKNPTDHTPPVNEASPVFSGAMWDHVGRDQLTWPLEDYFQLGEQVYDDLIAIPAKNFSSEDIALFPNLSQNQIQGIRRWVMALPPERRPTLVLKFSVLTFATPRFQDYRNKNLIPLLYRFGMKGLRAAHPRTVLCTDSEEMAASFGQIADVGFPVLPLPLTMEAGPPHGESDLCIAYLGYASPWKGFHLLPEIAAEITREPGRRFLIHSFGDEKLCAEVETKLQGNAAVEFVRGDVDRARYIMLLQQADILLMPYAAQIYGWASSGIFTEALSAGKVVVVPEQTWLARQLAEYHAGGATFATQDAASIVPVLRGAIADYETLAVRAALARKAWTARHNPASFVDQFLALAKL